MIIMTDENKKSRESYETIKNQLDKLDLEQLLELQEMLEDRYIELKDKEI